MTLIAFADLVAVGNFSDQDQRSEEGASVVVDTVQMLVLFEEMELEQLLERVLSSYQAERQSDRFWSVGPMELAGQEECQETAVVGLEAVGS